MLPLTFAKEGDTVTIARVGGRDDVKKHLGDLGFVEGSKVRVITSHEGDLIVNLKESKLAITKEMAAKVMIED